MVQLPTVGRQPGDRQAVDLGEGGHVEVAPLESLGRDLQEVLLEGSRLEEAL